MKTEYVTYRLENGSKSYFNQSLVRMLALGKRFKKQYWTGGICWAEHYIR